MPDHVHLLVEAPPTRSPAEIAGILKGVSSKRMRSEFLDIIQRHIWKENTLWAVGYYVSTVGDGVTTDLVKEYIANQKAKDAPKVANSEPVQLTLF